MPAHDDVVSVHDDALLYIKSHGTATAAAAETGPTSAPGENKMCGDGGRPFFKDDRKRRGVHDDDVVVVVVVVVGVFILGGTFFWGGLRPLPGPLALPCYTEGAGRGHVCLRRVRKLIDAHVVSKWLATVGIRRVHPSFVSSDALLVERGSEGARGIDRGCFVNCVVG